jgi:hypothetical protein
MNIISATTNTQYVKLPDKNSNIRSAAIFRIINLIKEMFWFATCKYIMLYFHIEFLIPSYKV